MKLSEVLQAIRLIKTGNHGTGFQKYQPSVTEMISGGISHHQSPYGHHLYLSPHYGNRGSIHAVPSVTHIIKHVGTGTSASGAYGGGQHGYHHTSGYGGHVGVSSGGHGGGAPAGYDYHPPTGHHVPVAETIEPVYTTGKSGKTGGSSTITALTLLSFLFFLNILQGCLKEHMDTMNPTVMVMTAGVARTRNSKLAEMNSREQQNSISHVLPVQPVQQQNLNRGEPYPDASTNVDNQTPFNGGGSSGSNTKIEYSNRPDPEPEYYPAYVNRTLTLAANNYQDRYHYPYRHYQRLPLPSPSSPSSSSSQSSFSSGSNSPSSNYYSETMDPYYTRIN